AFSILHPAEHRDLPSFPTRRSSDLTTPYRNGQGEIGGTVLVFSCLKRQKCLEWENEFLQDEVRENFGDIIGRSHAIQKVLAQIRSEEHTSELQSRGHLVCRLLLEKK